MDKNPHFLIAVPTFNRAHLIKKLLTSVEVQGYENYDICFVNDGSTDNTKEVLKDAAIENTKIHYVTLKKNSGVNAARNKILEIAELNFPSSFLYFIDDDDLIADNGLLAAAKAIRDIPNYNWYALQCINPDGNVISRINSYGESSYIDDNFLGKKIRGDLTHVVRVSCIRGRRFTERFRNAEEWFFWCNLSTDNKLYTVQRAGSIKEYLTGGLTDSGFNRDKAIAVIQYKLEVLEPIVGKARLLHNYVTLSKHLIALGEYKEAKKALDTVIACNPFYVRQYKHWVKLLLATKFL